MVLRRELALKTVLDGLSFLRLACEDRGKLGLFDLHVHAESFFCPFLNAAFGLNLQVLKTGHPAVDLGDAQVGKAFQITAQHGKAKVQQALDTYCAHGLFSIYPSLRILIIGKRQDTYAVRIPEGVTFDPAADIIDIQSLGAKIARMDTAQIGRLAEIVRAEFVNADVATKAYGPSDVLQVSLSGQVLARPETTCTFAPDAGWGLDLVFNNTSGEVLEPQDFSVAFVLPRRLFIKNDWHVTPPVYKEPVRLSRSGVLYELTEFNRLLPGARAKYRVPVKMDEDDPVAIGDSIAIKVLVHTKYGTTEYPVKLSAVTSDENLAELQHRSDKSTRRIKRLRPVRLRNDL